MRVYGLIGFPLSQSFSADFFNSKFKSLGLNDHIYKLFPINNIAELRNLLQSESGLAGLNVTIPYKEQVIDFLDDLSFEARSIGAVNCISIRSGKLTGHNTDCYGFEKAYISQILDAESPALILGNGGASKAVQYVLKEHDISFQIVSRIKNDQTILYENLTHEMIRSIKVIINTTPLGMYPETTNSPLLPYDQFTAQHFLIDLIYNPEKTEFLKHGLVIGCKTFNGLSMLKFQADKAWEIWESTL